MLKYHCFIENCQNKIIAKCDCEGSILFCQDHAFEHLSKPSSKRHQLIREFIKPSEEVKHLMIQKLINLKKEIKAYKSEAIESVNKIIENFYETFEKYLSQIQETDEICSKIIEELLNEEEFLDIWTENDIENVLKLDLQKAEWKMAGWSTSWCYLDYKEINEAISKTYEIPFNPFRKAVEDEIESNELSFFRHNASNFLTINLDSFQVSSTTALAIQEPIHASTSACILPDKTYFYCCNPNDNSGLAYTIDKNKNVKQLEKSKSNSYLDPIYYNNFVYLIGGNNRVAEKYDFKQNLWQNIALLPQGLNFNFSCNSLFGNLILITGYCLQKIICYSIARNNYKDIQNLELEGRCHKFMLRGNNRIYLFERGKRIFESAENDITTWTNIGNNSLSNGNYHRQSAVVRHEGSIYFVEDSNKLWRFGLSSKQLLSKTV